MASFLEQILEGALRSVCFVLHHQLVYNNVNNQAVSRKALFK